MTIDLQKALPGDKLQSKHGMILTYSDDKGFTQFPHRVVYPDGGYGSRTHDGFVYSNPYARKREDHDITRNLSQEEREAAAASKLGLGMADPYVFGAALVGSVPVARHCEFCGQEVKP